MRRLLIYPTSRAARDKKLTLDPAASLQTAVTTIAEFEQKILYVPQAVFIDTTKRTLFFNERLDASLFTKSESTFKLFEELAYEHVSLSQLLAYDTYASYENQIAQLQQLQLEYERYLESRGYTDKAFLPQKYALNDAFYRDFEQIDLFLDGYLTAFEREVFARVAKQVPLFLHMRTDDFTAKNKTFFTAQALESGYSYTIDYKSREVVAKTAFQDSINASVTAVPSRLQQAAFVMDSINELVRDEGIDPASIAVILPDESFKTLLQRFDRKNNLNFAMGFDYTKQPYYQQLNNFYTYLQTKDTRDARLLEAYAIEARLPEGKITAAMFFDRLDAMITPDTEAAGTRFYLQRAYEGLTLRFEEYLYLYCKELAKLRVDDTRGGKVTVMGALESRGSRFDGVIIVDFNDRFVPKVNQKDIYLNSSLKAALGLPTSLDRQNLQKHLYYSLMLQAKKSCICYSGDDAPSPFLNELGLNRCAGQTYDTDFFFTASGAKALDPEGVSFDPRAFVWSATMLKTYLGCKRRFYYRYIQKIAQPDSEQINEGDILHRALALCERFDASEIEGALARVSPNRFYTRLWMSKLKKFVAFEAARGGSVAAKEITAQKTICGLRCSGRADRIDLQQEGGHLLIDYKTGRIDNPVYNLEKMTDFQMPMYSLLFEQYQPALAYLPLFAPKLVPVKALEEKMRLFESHMKQLAQTTQLVPQKTEDEKRCVYCPYKLLCRRDVYS